jgi:hypothetical protein
MLSSPWLELQRRDRDPTCDFFVLPTPNDARASTASSSLRPAPSASMLHRHRLLFTVRPRPNLGLFSLCRRATMSRTCRAVRAVSRARPRRCSSARLALHGETATQLGTFSRCRRAAMSRTCRAVRAASRARPRRCSSARLALHGETATQLGTFRAADAQPCHASAAPFARHREPSASMLHRRGSVFTVRPRPNLPLHSRDTRSLPRDASSAPFALHGETATQLGIFFALPTRNDVTRLPRRSLPRRRRRRRSVDAFVPAARQAVPFDPEWDSRDHVGRVPRHIQGILLQREATTQLGILWRCRRAKTRAYWPVVCAVSKAPLRRHRHGRRQTGDEGREHTERGRRAAPRDGGMMYRSHGRPARHQDRRVT